MRNRWLVRIFILVLLIFVTGCAPEEAANNSPEVVKPPSGNEQSDPSPESEVPEPIDAPVDIQAFLSSSEVIAWDDFEQLDPEKWNSMQARIVDQKLRLEGAEGEDSLLGRTIPVSSGQAVQILFRYEESSEFEIFMDVGDWDTPDYKRWGLYQLEDLTANYWEGAILFDPMPVFSNDFALVPGEWYYGLFVAGEEQAVQHLWAKDDPGQYGSLNFSFPEGWSVREWDFQIFLFQGVLEIEEFGLLSGGLTASEPPHVESTPDEPKETAELIFYNGDVLTITSGLPIEQAIALQGDMILAVGSDDEIMQYTGEDTQMVDLEGRTLMPGFVDPHTHILNDAEAYLDLDLFQAQELALSQGITTLANMYVEEWFLQQLMDLEADGDLRVRTSVYLVGSDNCGAPLGDWYLAYPPSDEFGEILRIGGVKLFTDGGTCGYPAVTEETHFGAGQGTLAMSDEQLRGLIQTADDAGYQLAIHALGDRAIDQVIDALSEAIEEPGNPERHRLEHAFYLREDQYGRFSESGVNPVLFGYWPTCAVDGSGRTENYKQIIRRWREVIDANPDLIIAMKTDLPWMGDASPLLELYSLTTLKEEAPDGSICDPPDWLADQTLTVEEALPMLTINAAYVLFREDEVGSLEPGKLADLIIISGNPQEMDTNDLKDIEVLMTMVGGETEFCLDGFDQFCP